MLQIPARWQFRSITHRLVAACVLAAALIYSLSYVHIRKVVQDNLQHWMAQVASAKLDAMATRIAAELARRQAAGQPGDASRAWLVEMVGTGLHWQDQGSGVALGTPFVWEPAAQHWLLAAPAAQALQALLQTPGSLPPEGSSRVLRADAEGLLVLHCLPRADACIGVSLAADKLAEQLWQYLLLVLISMGKDMLLILAAIALASRHTTKGLRALTAATEDIAHGQLDAPMPRIRGRDEVSRLATAFQHMRASLKDHITELQQATATQQKIESELAIASQIQQSMVPAASAADTQAGYAISALLLPAREVGGDFYDYFVLGDGQLCVALGDVSGKGVPAALMMARCIALLRALAPQLRTPDATLAAVNRELCVNNDECMFVTVVCAMLDLRSGTLRYASAGHDAPLLRRAGRLQPLPLETGTAAGLEPRTVYPQQTLQLQADDLLLLFSDGITEASNGADAWFGEARLQAAMSASKSGTAAALLATVQAELARFVAGAAPSDDISMLALQYSAAAHTSSHSDPDTQERDAMHWTLDINGQSLPLAAARPHLAAWLAARNCPAALSADAELVAEELLINIANYSRCRSGHISLGLVWDDAEGLAMRFEDAGQAFNPLLEIQTPERAADDPARAQGGYGFELVRRLSSALSYQRVDGHNVLHVRLKP